MTSGTKKKNNKQISLTLSCCLSRITSCSTRPSRLSSSLPAWRATPDARGIFHNDQKNFLVWVNEEDHTRLISMQKGGDMKAVFRRFCEGLGKVRTPAKNNTI